MNQMKTDLAGYGLHSRQALLEWPSQMTGLAGDGLRQDRPIKWLRQCCGGTVLRNGAANGATAQAMNRGGILTTEEDVRVVV